MGGNENQNNLSLIYGGVSGHSIVNTEMKVNKSPVLASGSTQKKGKRNIPINSRISDTMGIAEINKSNVVENNEWYDI